MAQTFYAKQNDTGIPLVMVLKDAAGPIDLTGWTITLVMTLQGKTERIIDEADVTIDADQTANKGKVSYQWQENDLAQSGLYDVELVATNPLNQQVTFPRQPNDAKYLRIVVLESKAE